MAVLFDDPGPGLGGVEPGLEEHDVLLGVIGIPSPPSGPSPCSTREAARARSGSGRCGGGEEHLGRGLGRLGGQPVVVGCAGEVGARPMPEVDPVTAPG
jgi:hypothetical protein